MPLTQDVSQVVFPCNEVADESARNFAGDIAWTTGRLQQSDSAGLGQILSKSREDSDENSWLLNAFFPEDSGVSS